jgi:hypothetical protein
VKDKLQAITCELIAQSLLAWDLTGRVQSKNDDAITVACNATLICVEPAPAGLPFRWMVTINGRKRGAISLVAVLRQIRTTLDADYTAGRVRIAPLPAPPA